MASNRDYFAHNLDVDDLNQKIEEYYNELERIGWLSRIHRSYAQFYGSGFDSTTFRIVSSGKQGEYSNLSTNHYRALLQHQLTLVTSERPAVMVRPINTDYRSQTQAILGGQIFDYYLSHRRVEEHLKSAIEKALWASEGFLHMRWNALTGDLYSRNEDGSPLMTGDIEFSTAHTLDVVRDIYKEGEQDWQMVREYINRYELAARFPEAEQKIMNLPGVNENEQRRKWGIGPRGNTTDIVEFWTLYHRRTVAVPKGLYCYFIETEILQQGELPYEEVPLYRVAPGNVSGYCLGYTAGFDMLGPQEAYDRMFSAILSNNVAFARQNLLVPRDANISHHALAEGLSVIKYDISVDNPNAKIEPLQLVKSSPESYQVMQIAEGNMEKISGINAVVRGDPQANLRSGNALALISAQAIKFNSGLENSANRLLEDVGTGTLSMLKKFSKAPRFFFIVGKHNQSMMEEFVGEDIEGASRVEVKATSALSKTAAGKIELANFLVQNKLLDTADQYITVQQTGQLEPMIEAKQSQMLNIRAENELLKEGKPATMLALDNHAVHINEHKSVLDDPAARENPQVADAVLAHIMEHYQQWEALSMSNPGMLAALGMQPLPPPAGMLPQPADPSGVQEPQAAQNAAPQLGEPAQPELPDAADAGDQAAYERS